MKPKINKLKAFPTKKRDFFQLARVITRPYIYISKSEYDYLQDLLSKNKTDGLTDGQRNYTTASSVDGNHYALCPMTVNY